MTHELTKADDAKRSSSGHVLSGSEWLEVHFAACDYAYETLLNAAGFMPGMSVLDAGCGTGPFLPLLRDRVGPRGHVYAMDLDVENITAARHRTGVISQLALGSVASLPYTSETFDGVWSANVLQYFSDDEALDVIQELCRVTKPTGIVAIKDVDMTALKLSPAPSFLGLHLAEACIRGSAATTQSFGSLRGRDLGAFLRRAGLSQVRQTPLLVEYAAPLTAAQTQLWSDWLPYLASLAISKGVPDEDLDVWRQLTTHQDAARFIAQPDFYACELQVVAVGRVP